MNKPPMKVLSSLVVVFLVILCLIFIPLITIWALNTLFPILAIPYSFYSWLAVIVMNATWLYKPSFKRT